MDDAEDVHAATLDTQSGEPEQPEQPEQVERPSQRPATVVERLQRWVGPPRNYVLVRWMILRLLGVVYLFAFLGIVWQGLPLLGAHGLTPARAYVEQLRAAGQSFWDVPSLFVFDPSDAALRSWAIVGVALSAALLVGYANL